MNNKTSFDDLEKLQDLIKKYNESLSQLRKTTNESLGIILEMNEEIEGKTLYQEKKKNKSSLFNRLMNELAFYSDRFYDLMITQPTWSVILFVILLTIILLWVSYPISIVIGLFMAGTAMRQMIKRHIDRKNTGEEKEKRIDRIIQDLTEQSPNVLEEEMLNAYINGRQKGIEHASRRHSLINPSTTRK